MSGTGGLTMARLTDADKALEMDALKNNPVLCKDCKHLMFSDFYGECKRGNLGIVKPDDFCSYGERKDGDGNG